MVIEQLCIYPIKGMGGINVESALALERGLEHDRRYMLVDPSGKFLSQRGLEKMALFRPSIIGNQLHVQFKAESIILDMTQEEGALMNTTVWEHMVDAIQVGKKASEWFSDQLGQSCVLVKMNKDSKRIKRLKKDPNQTQMSFADGYPYLVLGTASVDYLNSKLEVPVPMDRFRANIIVNTSQAHEEDEVDECTINGLRFSMIKPCARCQVITIDQQKAIGSKEPLKTLSTYRKKVNKVYFGMNVVCMDEGVISVGDILKKQ